MKDPSGDSAAPIPAEVFLLDGTALAYRAHFAFQSRPLTTSSGVETSAVFGFVLTLIQILKQNPRYLAVVFDLPGPTFRHERYAEYKANRPPTPEPLIEQLGKIREVTEALGVQVVEKEGFEADDIIATLAKQGQAEGLETVIVSADKDLLQMVGEGVTAYQPGAGRRPASHLDVGGVETKMGVRPEQVVDLLALMGDSSDNVPGVPGIGAKTAGKLIKEFGNMEGVYRNLEKVKPDRIRKALEEHRDDAYLSRELVALKTDVELDVTVDDLEPAERDRARLESLFRELEFLKLLAQVVPAEETTPAERVVAGDKADAKSIADLLSGMDTVAVDVDPGEGPGGDPRSIHFATTDDRVFSVDLEGDGGGSLEDFRSILEGDEPGIWAVSSKNLAKILARSEILLGGVDFDIELAAYLLNPGRPRDLATLCAQYLGRLPEGVEPEGKQGTLNLPFGAPPETGATRASIVAQLVPVLRPLLADQDLTALYEDIEIPLAQVLARMEMAGVEVDAEFLRGMSDRLAKDIGRIEEQVHKAVGEEFNLASPQQLKHVLFDTLGLKPGKRTKTGYSTDSSVLETLADEHEVPRLVLEHRHLAKLKSTYLDALPAMINPETGRIHTTFHQSVTITGRLSSSDPNLQNIPMRTELGRELRKAFVSRGPDWRVYSVDYSQIELRIVAHLSGDPGLVQAFGRGEDIHRATAATVTGVALDQVTPQARDRAKAVNFGIIYGMGPRALGKNVGISLSEAKAFIEDYFESYPGVKAFIDETIEDARRAGYVTTLFGRRRYLPELESESPRDRAFGERTAVNTRVQGTAADIIKRAMVEIDRRIRSEELAARMILQVHDELVFDVPVEEMDALRAIVTEEMVAAAPLDVPVEVQGGQGMSWYEAH
jgi:DNA polymerase-1